MISWYSEMLFKKPIITKAITGFIIFGLGDYLCQELELRYLKKPGELEYMRILKQASFGIIVSPYLHLQYCKIIPWMFPKSDVKSTILSTAYAVTLSDGSLNLAFFIFMSLFNFKKKQITNSDNSNEKITESSNVVEVSSKKENEIFFANLKDDIMSKFIPVQINSMKVWSILTCINFYFVPVSFRVLFDNFFCIFWNIYLSFVEYNHDKKK